jgi:4-alpha-glucanotransferase
MVTDLFGTSQRFNVPGAVADSNWSARIETPVSEWDKDPYLNVFLEEVHDDLARLNALSHCC